MLSCTLNEIRAASPCADGWAKLLAHLGKTASDDTVVDLATVLDSNGLDDALWVLDNVIKNRRIISLFAGDCAERVLPIFERQRPNDERPRRAIEVARNPSATKRERDAARDAAWDAAEDARDAAGAAGAAWAAGAAGAAGPAAWAARAARDAARETKSARLRQYIEHGEAAADMPWPNEQDERS